MKIIKKMPDKVNYNYLDFKTFIFPGGEIGLKLNSNNYNFLWNENSTIIVANIQNSNDFFQLAMAKNALENLGETNIKLFLPYVPYGRQDRICDKGESFSLKVFTNLLNSLNFNKVIICDPHSDVTGALINNVKIITQFDIINKWLELTNLAKNCIIISPDAGGNKKTVEIAKYFEHKHFIRADKLRDLATGQIKETIVYCDDFNKRDVVCFDDIIDGGRTFIELAKVCKNKNCGKFILYATHGIFSKGIDELLNNGIDEIWTTNSFKQDLKENSKLHILNLEEKFVDLI